MAMDACCFSASFRIGGISCLGNIICVWVMETRWGICCRYSSTSFHSRPFYFCFSSASREGLFFRCFFACSKSSIITRRLLTVGYKKHVCRIRVAIFRRCMVTCTRHRRMSIHMATMETPSFSPGQHMCQKPLLEHTLSIGSKHGRYFWGCWTILKHEHLKKRWSEYIDFFSKGKCWILLILCRKKQSLCVDFVTIKRRYIENQSANLSSPDEKLRPTFCQSLGWISSVRKGAYIWFYTGSFWKQVTASIVCDCRRNRVLSLT